MIRKLKVRHVFYDDAHSMYTYPPSYAHECATFFLGARVTCYLPVRLQGQMMLLGWDFVLILVLCLCDMQVGSSSECVLSFVQSGVIHVAE